MESTAASLGRPILDRACTEIEDPDHIESGLDHLFDGLRSLKKYLPAPSWEGFCRTVCVTHPVRYLVHQDPLTERAFFKPKGYAGDPALLDLFYGDDAVRAELRRVTDLGRRIYHYTSNTRVAQALRRRREILASLIDGVSFATEKCHILTLDCGFLREVEGCEALKQRRVDRFLALDRDPENLSVVQDRFGPLGVETAVGTVHDVLDGAGHLGAFDLIYSPGLYDYLNRGIASRLTAALFRSMRPGGTLLVTNMVHGLWDTGYMEAFMDWKLNYRNVQELFALTASVPEDAVADRRAFLEESGGIAFMVLRKQ